MDENTFYVEDLVGCTVVTIKGETLGVLRQVIKTGANDVYVVNEGKEEILIPALRAVVKKIDTTAKSIEVDLPEGLRTVVEG